MKLCREFDSLAKLIIEQDDVFAKTGLNGPNGAPWDCFPEFPRAVWWGQMNAEQANRRNALKEALIARSAAVEAASLNEARRASRH